VTSFCIVLWRRRRRWREAQECWSPLEKRPSSSWKSGQAWARLRPTLWRTQFFIVILFFFCFFGFVKQLQDKWLILNSAMQEVRGRAQVRPFNLFFVYINFKLVAARIEAATQISRNKKAKHELSRALLHGEAHAWPSWPWKTLVFHSHRCQLSTP
jgi:hypothetical protein